MRTALRVLGNGLQTAFAYRGTPSTPGDNQLASLTVETAPGANNRPPLSYTYSYDANKNPTAENRGASGSAADDYSFATTYDAKDRLTAWLRDNGDHQNWNLSFVGDWNTTDGSIATSGGGFDQSRTHNDVHEIVTLDPDNTGGASPIALAHDAKGNLTRDDAPGGGMVLSCDFDNQLQQAVVPSGATRGLVGTHTYRYDALGRRVAKNVDTNADNTPDTTTIFIYNARWQFIAEYVGGASPTSPTRSRIYSAGYVDEPLAQVEHTGATAGTYDCYHLREHVIATSGMLHEEGSKQARDWVEDMMGYVWSQGAMVMLDRLGTVPATSPHRRQARGASIPTRLRDQTHRRDRLPLVPPGRLRLRQRPDRIVLRHPHRPPQRPGHAMGRRQRPSRHGALAGLYHSNLWQTCGHAQRRAA